MKIIMSKEKKYLGQDKKQIRHYKRKKSELEDTSMEIREKKTEKIIHSELILQFNAISIKK